MVLTEQSLWQKYASGIFRLVIDSQFDRHNQLVCFSNKTISVDLANSNPEISNFNICSLCNIVPKWSPVFEPCHELSSSYNTFLNYIEPDCSRNDRFINNLCAAANELTSADETFHKETAKSLLGLKTIKEIYPLMTFDQYLRKYGENYIVSKKYLNKAKLNYEGLLLKNDDAVSLNLREARRKVSPFKGGARSLLQKSLYNMRAKTGLRINSDFSLQMGLNEHLNALNEVFMPSFKLEGFGTAYAEWQQKSAKGEPGIKMIELDGSTIPLTFCDLGWCLAVSPSLLGPFISFLGFYDKPEHLIKHGYLSTGFNIKVYFTGFGIFRIRPGGWFQSELIYKFRNKLLREAPVFFGENGILSLIPHELIIGFEPSLEIQLHNSDYKEVKSMFTSAGCRAIKFGPFTLGDDALPVSKNKEDIFFNDQTSSIKSCPVKNGLPILLGVICNKYK